MAPPKIRGSWRAFFYSRDNMKMRQLFQSKLGLILHSNKQQRWPYTLKESLCPILPEQPACFSIPCTSVSTDPRQSWQFSTLPPTHWPLLVKSRRGFTLIQPQPGQSWEPSGEQWKRIQIKYQLNCFWYSLRVRVTFSTDGVPTLTTLEAPTFDESWYQYQQWFMSKFQRLSQQRKATLLPFPWFSNQQEMNIPCSFQRVKIVP